MGESLSARCGGESDTGRSAKRLAFDENIGSQERRGNFALLWNEKVDRPRRELILMRIFWW